MKECKMCMETFESHSKYANHIRWKHKEKPYTEEGLKKVKENTSKNNSLRFGNYIVVQTNCSKCNTEISVKFREGKKKEKYFCSRTCANSRPCSDEVKKKKSLEVLNNPEKYKIFLTQSKKSFKTNNRFSSKSERLLASSLGVGFKRHLNINGFDVDIYREDKKVWIESDGPWHFEKVRPQHDFEKTKYIDSLKESYALANNILLVRINNTKFTLNQQLVFVDDSIKNWNGEGKVIKFY